MKERIEQFCYTKKDFNLDWYSGTGKGGQHRNKHQNSLRLKHIPSGIVVISADNRDRNSNLRVAFDRLKPKLIFWIKQQLMNTVPIKIDEVIRTYSEHDNYVKDIASGKRIMYSELDKKFGELVDSRNTYVSNRVFDGIRTPSPEIVKMIKEKIK